MVILFREFRKKEKENDGIFLVISFSFFLCFREKLKPQRQCPPVKLNALESISLLY